MVDRDYPSRREQIHASFFREIRERMVSDRPKGYALNSMYGTARLTLTDAVGGFF